MKIAIVGASGMVGRTFLKVLEERKIKAQYFLFASSKSAGKTIKFFDKEYEFIELNADNVCKVKPDYALFSAGKDISIQYAPIFTELGCMVIDNSSAFRTDSKIPLVVPECNADILLNNKSKIISNPNCSTIGAVVALKPLDDVYGIKRVIYSTYQAVSGAGQEGVNDLYSNMRGEQSKKFLYQIYNNLIPHIDSFLDDGNTKEEQKMIHETRKILGKPKLPVTATTVRVPIENCHSISINAEFSKPFDIGVVKDILAKSPGIVLADVPQDNFYPMPILANNRDEVFVGRVRRDSSRPNTINLFTVSDNIRKGAATNAVQILELLIANHKNPYASSTPNR